MDAVIGDARELQYQGNELLLGGRKIGGDYGYLVPGNGRAKSDHASDAIRPPNLCAP